MSEKPRILPLPKNSCTLTITRSCRALVLPSGEISTGQCAQQTVEHEFGVLVDHLHRHGYQGNFSNEKSMTGHPGGDRNCLRGSQVFKFGEGCMGGKCVSVDTKGAPRECRHVAYARIHIKKWNLSSSE